MFWYLLFAGFFAWLIYREIQRPVPFDAPRGSFSYGYMGTLSLLFLFCAWLIIDHVRFERMLTQHARVVSGNPDADVHCQSLLETMLDPMPMAVAHARPDTGQIEFKATWCSHLADHLDDPANAQGEALWAMHVFTHEVMHIRGELNEQITDCQAYQRNQAMAERFGIPRDIAARNATAIYENRSRHKKYFSAQCRAGGRLDESLPTPPWPVLAQRPAS
ncbi:MAG: hypothetical protein AAF499_01350 [Pseudomonadota bacterium]